MAIGPSDIKLSPADAEAADGLEKAIDGKMTARAVPGQPFETSFHPDYTHRVVSIVVGRYKEAGWSEINLDFEGRKISFVK